MVDAAAAAWMPTPPIRQSQRWMGSTDMTLGIRRRKRFPMNDPTYRNVYPETVVQSFPLLHLTSQLHLRHFDDDDDEEDDKDDKIKIINNKNNLENVMLLTKSNHHQHLMPLPSIPTFLRSVTLTLSLLWMCFCVSPESSLALSPSSDASSTLSSAIKTKTTTTLIKSETTTTTPWPLSLSSLAISAQPQESAAVVNTLDEVWTLVDKYYLNRNQLTHWDQVREQFATQFAKVSSSSSFSLSSQQFDIVRAMVQTLGDKYSRLITADQYAQIQRFDLIGVGVTLMPDPTVASRDASTTGSTEETSPPTTMTTATAPTKTTAPLIVGAPPLPGSAADQAGIQQGDVVVAVNGVPTKGRNALDVVDQLANSGGTNKNQASNNENNDKDDDNQFVTMTIVPKIHAQEEKLMDYARNVKMQRSFVKVDNPIRYKITETRSDGTTIGLVRITEFNSLVQPKLQEALQNLQAAGANAYVIDLRQNTGGAFQSAVEVSSYFMPGEQTATIVVDNANTRLPFRTASGREIVDGNEPIAIWIDDRTASASEVLAGSLHDNCRAVLMGKPSFGKGLIQAVYGLQSGEGLILTVARYTTPSGQEIQGVGLQPDIPGHTALLLPGLSTDTSQVDFAEVKERLAMCHPPASS